VGDTARDLLGWWWAKAAKYLLHQVHQSGAGVRLGRLSLGDPRDAALGDEVEPVIVAVAPLDLAHRDGDFVLLDDHLGLRRVDLLLQVLLAQPVALAVEPQHAQVERAASKLALDAVLGLADAVEARREVHVDVGRLLAVVVLVPGKASAGPETWGRWGGWRFRDDGDEWSSCLMLV